MRGHYTILYNRLVNERLVIIQPSDRVLVLRSLERCFIRCVTRHGYRSIVPTGKRVGVFCGCFLACVCVLRNYTILNGCLIDQRIVVVQPRDGVLVLRSTERCLVRCVTCYCNRRIVPTGKCIGVLSGILLGCIRVRRHSTIFYYSLVDQCVVIIHPRNRVLVHNRCVRSSICSSTCDVGNRRCPARKRVSVLCCSSLGRLLAEQRQATIIPYRIFVERTIIVEERDSVTHQVRLVLCSVCCCTCHGYHLWCPSVELIFVLRSSSLGRRGRASRRSAVLPLLGFNRSAVLVLERDRIFVHGLRELCSVCRISRYGYRRLIPSGERVAILRRSCLGGRSTRIGGHRTISHLLCLQSLAVTVFPRDLIFFHRARERCFVRCIACYLCQSRNPFVERISVLRCRSLSRCLRLGHRAVLQNLLINLFIRIVQIRYGVTAHRATELSGISCIGSCSNYGRQPYINERVRVVRGLGLRRCCSCVSRCHAVSDFLGLQRLAVAIHPGDGEQVRFCRERSRISCIPRDGCYARIPSGKRIYILIGGRLRRLRTSRRCTIFPLFRLDRCAVVVEERDGVLVHRLRIGCSVCSMCCCGYKCLIPTLERIGVLRITRLGRRIAAIYWHFSFFHLVRLKQCTILVNEANREVMRVASVGIQVVPQ